MDRACHPQDAAVASSVTSKARTSDRDLIAVTAHESGILCQGAATSCLIEWRASRSPNWSARHIVSSIKLRLDRFADFL
jgi:hypothetical protein